MARTKKPSNVARAGVKKPHRFRPGTVALREIRKLQKGTDLIVEKAVIDRMIKETLSGATIRGKDVRVSEKAREAFQHQAEAWSVGLLEDVNLMAIHGKRVTVMPKDLVLAERVILN